MSEQKLDAIIERLGAHGEILARLDERSEAQDSRIENVEGDVRVLREDQKKTAKKINAVGGAGGLVAIVAGYFGLGG